MKKILLIRPADDEDGIAVDDVATHLPFFDRKSFMVPLDLATVAALTPEDVAVELWDERLRGRVDDSNVFHQQFDLVGVTGYAVHIRRTRKIGRLFRDRGALIVAGGPGVSAAPERYRDIFDVLFIGEAEYTWPQFIQEWKAGSHKPEYRQVTKVDMTHSPVPRWDKVADDLKHYLVGGVQTTRGCPFDCEFCDVIYIFGRLQRHKSIEQVLEEVATLERLGMPHIFFCDDNFYGNPKYYKALLKALIPLNRSFEVPISFNTQIDIRVGKDEEMLELLADANFTALLIGIESPNRESLIETNARKNLKADLVEDVKRIQSYGIEVVGSMIVGFDHDDTTIFQQVFDFLQETGIPNSNLCPLRAMAGTKLWTRLLKDGRVLGLASDFASEELMYDDVPFTNIMPKLMSREEMLSGWFNLVDQVRDWRHFEARVKGMVSRVKRQPKIRQTISRFNRKQRWGLIRFILFSMDPKARGPVLRLLLYTRRKAPYMMPKVFKMILHNYLCRATMPLIGKAIEDQIRREASGEYQLQPRVPGFFIPDEFRKPYKTIFPGLYERVYRGLVDKSRAEDTMIEVVYDFLTRWGPTFEQFEEYHQTFFYEICDRCIAEENAKTSIPLTVLGTADEGTEDVDVPDIRRNRLADEVLRTVEQDLRSFKVANEAAPVYGNV